METTEEEENQPDPHNQLGFDNIMLTIRMRAGAILLGMRMGKTPNWIEQEPTEWVMMLMTLMKGCSRAIMNYRDLRKGFIEMAACLLICINFMDQIMDDKQKHGG